MLCFVSWHLRLCSFLFVVVKQSRTPDEQIRRKLPVFLLPCRGLAALAEDVRCSRARSHAVHGCRFQCRVFVTDNSPSSPCRGVRIDSRPVQASFVHTWHTRCIQISGNARVAKINLPNPIPRLLFTTPTVHKIDSRNAAGIRWFQDFFFYILVTIMQYDCPRRIRGRYLMIICERAGWISLHEIFVRSLWLYNHDPTVHSCG